jgi:hypothetical protein
VLVREAGGHAAVAGCGRDHLRRSRANVADREDSGAAALDEEWRAAERPPRFAIHDGAAECWSGQDERIQLRT